MNLLFLLPKKMRVMCFADKDVQRLADRYRIVSNDTDDPDVLIQLWDEHAATIDAVMTGWGTPPLTDAMLDAAGQLKVLMHAAGSIKHLLPPSFWQRSIRVGTVNDALAVGVAETTLGMIITGLKGLFPCCQLTRSGRWKRGDTDTFDIQIRELYDQTIGIIGASKVGRHVIRLLKAFEVRVLLTDPCVSADEAADLGVQLVTLDQLMRRSDVVTLHAPLLNQTRRMIGTQQFEAMKDGAIFINTARGAIVDESALITELQRKRIFAFIDVTDPEPPATDHPLRRLPNVVLTPHIAGAVANGGLRQGRSAVDQLLQFADDNTMSGEVTARMLTTMA